MTTTDDMYQRAYSTFADRAETTRHGVRAVVDLVLAERPEPTDWETLRAAADISFHIGLTTMAGRLRAEADRLEAEHAATQAKAAAADAAREALIKKVSARIHYVDHGYEIDDCQICLLRARNLAAAGLLVDPEAEATA